MDRAFNKSCRKDTLVVHDPNQPDDFDEKTKYCDRVKAWFNTTFPALFEAHLASAADTAKSIASIQKSIEDKFRSAPYGGKSGKYGKFGDYGDGGKGGKYGDSKSNWGKGRCPWAVGGPSASRP